MRGIKSFHGIQSGKKSVNNVNQISLEQAVKNFDKRIYNKSITTNFMTESPLKK